MRPCGIDLWLWPFFIAIPLLLLGGIYWFPACRISRERDPLLTVLLALGLATTVTLVGVLSGLSTGKILAGIAAAWLLLLLRRALGHLGHNLERFGPVHALAFIGILALSGRPSA